MAGPSRCRIAWRSAPHPSVGRCAVIADWFRRRRYLRFTRHVAGAIRRRLIRVIALFLALFMVHAAAMMALEGLSAGDAVWLTITTATTVGYGDISAATPAGRLATVLCMYLFGIFLLAQAASDLFDFRALRRERRRRGEFRWRNMKDHLLIVNVPGQDADSYLVRLVHHVRRAPSLADIPVQLLTPRYADGLPQQLVDAGVIHYNGVAESTDNLAAANAARARCIIVIADEPYDPRSDSHTYDILSRLRALDGGAADRVVVAEVVEDSNRQRILAAGATTALRPLRAYPEMVVRALATPGVEQVLENLFTHDADHLMRFDVPFRDLRWADVVASFITGGGGLPLGYVQGNRVNTNPHPRDECSGSGIITLIDERLTVTRAQVEACLAGAAPGGSR